MPAPMTPENSMASQSSSVDAAMERAGAGAEKKTSPTRKALTAALDALAPLESWQERKRVIMAISAYYGFEEIFDAIAAAQEAQNGS